MLWVKVFHILAMTSWMAGVFYLPRIFVHYVEGAAVGEKVTRLQVMAVKLFKFSSIMALFTIGLGMWLWLGYGFSGAWLHAKLTFVVLLLVFHVSSGYFVRQIVDDTVQKSGKFFRLYNELPLLIFLPILILVVVKPF